MDLTEDHLKHELEMVIGDRIILIQEIEILKKNS
jgi:hypothetical protein